MAKYNLFSFFVPSTRLTSQDVLPNPDPSLPNPYFSTFTDIAFAQTMILFIETIFVLLIWHSERPLFWFCRYPKTKDKYDEGDEDKEVACKVGIMEMRIELQGVTYHERMTVSVYACRA